MITTIINYCTNDYRFLDLCIEEAKKISTQIIIPVCDHFFNGTPENRELLQRSYSEHPDCEFIEFEYGTPYGIYCPLKPDDDNWIHYWHSTSRYVGYHFLREEITHVLFLDVDEIIDSGRFIERLKTIDCNAARFSSYFYFRKASSRATMFPLNALLIKKDIVEPEKILSVYERKGLFEEIDEPKINHVMGLDGKPLVHHYSWVKPQEELRHKVKSWGHHFEKNWEELLEKEFSKEFSGVDDLYGLTYEEVEQLHDPLKEIKPSKSIPTSFPNVKKVDSKEILRLGIRKLAGFL